MPITQIADDQLFADLVFRWRGDWTLGQPYPSNHLARADGSVYISKVNQSGAILDTRPGTGVNWRLVWDLFVERGTGVEVGMIVRETPVGLINDSNAIFTLAHPVATNKEQVFLNGLLQEPGGEDYNIVGQTITFIDPLVTGDRLRVTYIQTL